MNKLKKPTRKHKTRVIPQFSFPVQVDSYITENDSFTRVCTGYIMGDSVVVKDNKDINTIFNNGFFGKGSVSKSAPRFVKSQDDVPQIVRDRQWNERCKWSKLLSNIKVSKEEEIEDIDIINVDDSDDDECGKLAATKDCSNQNNFEFLGAQKEVLVIADSDDDDEHFLQNLNPRLEFDKCLLPEVLILTLQEAFFLSFALGCLVIYGSSGDNLSLEEMWTVFCKADNSFIPKYVTYHYFRAKGWVVKPGIKYGGDYLLYKNGPPFYHASYLVLVEVLDEDTLGKATFSNSRNMSWVQLMGLNRLAETAGKEILLSQVVWPIVLPKNGGFSPSNLSKFTVHEVLVRRWISSQEREEDE